MGNFFTLVWLAAYLWSAEKEPKSETANFQKSKRDVRVGMAVARAPWWAGRVFFTLREAGCLVSEIAPSQFSYSERAQSVANEILLLARDGKTPLSSFDSHPYIETYPKGKGAPLIFRWVELPGQNFQYDNGECDLGSTITKDQITQFAKRNDWDLPWTK